MEKFLFETHYGKSSVTDIESGVIVEWQNGKFNETNTARIDPSRVMAYDAGQAAAMLAKACREIGDYIAKEYPELI